MQDEEGASVLSLARLLSSPFPFSYTRERGKVTGVRLFCGEGLHAEAIRRVDAPLPACAHRGHRGHRGCWVAPAADRACGCSRESRDRLLATPGPTLWHGLRWRRLECQRGRYAGRADLLPAALHEAPPRDAGRARRCDSPAAGVYLCQRTSAV